MRSVILLQNETGRLKCMASDKEHLKLSQRRLEA